MAVKDEYIKRLGALEQIEKIARDNNFQTIPKLGLLYRNIKNALDVARHYEKWQLDISDYNLWNDFGEIEYGVGIYKYSEINNHGRIEPEELLTISFPTGAYTFGGDYDIELFEEFYKELHLVEPKYEDTLNGVLYYSEKNGKEAYDHYKSTYKKYCDIFKERCKRKRIKELEDELLQLKSQE